MIRLERTVDYELVRLIMTHPRMYPFLADDFCPAPEDFHPNESPAVVYLLVFDGADPLGCFVTHPINALLWEVHACLLPHAWGRRAREAGKAYLAWLWEFTGARKVVGFIPASNPLMLRYARGLGLTEVGRLTQCYQRAFQLYDLIILGRDRPQGKI